jgi:hypothetical protein
MKSRCADSVTNGDLKNWRGKTWGKGLIKLLTSVERSRESNGLKSESQGSDKVVEYCLFGTSSELGKEARDNSLSEPGEDGSWWRISRNEFIHP